MEANTPTVQPIRHRAGSSLSAAEDAEGQLQTGPARLPEHGLPGGLCHMQNAQHGRHSIHSRADQEEMGIKKKGSWVTAPGDGSLKAFGSSFSGIKYILRCWRVKRYKSES